MAGEARDLERFHGAGDVRERERFRLVGVSESGLCGVERRSGNFPAGQGTLSDNQSLPSVAE